MQTLSQTDICNLALMRLGQRKIQSITDQADGNAIACNVGWLQALGEVSRAAPWNCLRSLASLGQFTPAIASSATNWNTNIPSTATTWAPGQNYAVNAYVIFAGYLYQCLIANTSSTSFTVDLTKGWWFQTNTYSPTFFGSTFGVNIPGTDWSYAYQLPVDFVALIELNENNCWGGGGAGGGGWGFGGNTTGSSHEIYQKALYTNASYANIKYVRWEPDTTNYDSAFTGSLVVNLAAIIATQLRKDSGELALSLRREFEMMLTQARVRNSNEDKPRRYSIVSESRFVRSRFRGTNG